MSTKKLPLVDSPIRGYMMYSYHLGVTFSHIDAWPWLFTNFVQLQCKPSQLELTDLLDFSTMPKGEVHFTEGTSPYNPWLKNSRSLSDSDLATMVDHIAPFVENAIRTGCYVETFVDEYYIPALFNGSAYHFGHRLLVLGYDGTAETFDIVGFDKNSQYRQLQCSYAALDEAFAQAAPRIAARTKLFEPPTLPVPEADFNRTRFLAVLHEYLDSRNTLLNPDLRGDLKRDTTLWYGLQVYDFLIQYVLNYTAFKGPRVLLGPDIRGFQIAWEHKSCMANRLRWFMRSGYAIPQALVDRYAKVVSLLAMVRSRIVMCRRKLLPIGQGYLDDIPKWLEEARQIEKEVLYAVAHIMEQPGAARHDVAPFPRAGGSACRKYAQA